MTNKTSSVCFSSQTSSVTGSTALSFKLPRAHQMKPGNHRKLSVFP